MTKAKLERFLEKAHEWAIALTDDEDPQVLADRIRYEDPIQERVVTVFNNGRIIIDLLGELPPTDPYAAHYPPMGSKHTIDRYGD